MHIEMDRERYDHIDVEDNLFKADEGITEELVREISTSKGEPEWMRTKRLAALAVFRTLPLPGFGPSIKDLDLSRIVYFIRPNAKKSHSWDDVPEHIKRTFERLGIPKAERHALGGVGAQYESLSVYHNLKEEWHKHGVIFTDMDDAVKKHEEMVKKYFMTSCLPPTLHKFMALHCAVWSGGTFIYVPKGVKVTIPLQAYFRMNAERGGQFEHTLIIVDEGAQLHYIEGCSAPVYNASSLHAGGVEIFVLKNARVRYSSIENWSKNTFNLNTKRAIVHEHGIIEWVGGNLGSGVTMLYPCSVLIGEYARSEHTSIAYAGKGQHQDVGAKVHHLAPNTSSIITSKSISKDGGITSYRGLVEVSERAEHTRSKVECDALMMDSISTSQTYPIITVRNDSTDMAHEASVGKINDDQIFYLMSRGLSEKEAADLIVSGFIEPIVKELPLEYAVELNRLIQLEMEGLG